MEEHNTAMIKAFLRSLGYTEDAIDGMAEEIEAFRCKVAREQQEAAERARLDGFREGEHTGFRSAALWLRTKAEERGNPDEARISVHLVRLATELLAAFSVKDEDWRPPQ